MKPVSMKSICAAIALAAVLPGMASAAVVVATAANPQALTEIRTRAEHGDVGSQYAWGVSFLRGTYGQTVDPAQAVPWLTKAADAGNPLAAFELAKLYDDGTGVARDSAKAMPLYQKALDGGRSEIAAYVCDRYTNPGTAADPKSPEDWAKAFPFCQKAVTAGDTDAAWSLGVAYYEGWGITADPALAVQFLQRAANRGKLPAMELLAQIYSDGKLLPRDDAQTFAWNRIAARNGSRRAVLAMAHSYETGEGVTADLPEAARLYEILARTGAPEAAAWLKAHPEFPAAALRANIVNLGDIRTGLILYAVDSNDPRFTTLDMAAYIKRLSEEIYPSKALDAEIGGTATAECRFTASGDLDDCIVVDESPKGYGFGPALIRMTDKLRDSGNRDAWSDKYAGKVLRLGARWKPQS